MAAKKIEIIYDINGKAIDVVIDKTLNLKQQVRELTKELNKTGQSAEDIQILSNKLNETKDNVAKVNAQSREFFSTLSLLPGPIGQFSNQIDNSIGLLKTFSSFKLSDIKNQIVGLGKDLYAVGVAMVKATGIQKLYNVTTVITAQVLKAVGIEATIASFGVRAFSAALVASGIGAAVVALGYFVSKLMETGDEADLTAKKVSRLNTEFEKLKVDSKFAGEELIAQMKAEGATADQIYATKKKLKQQDLDNARLAFKEYQTQITAAEIMDQKGTEGYKKAIEGRKQAEKDIKQYKHDLRIADSEELERKLKEDQAKNKTAKDKQIADSKTAQDRIIQDTKTYYDKLLTEQEQYELLLATSEEEAAVIRIDQKRKRQIAEVNALKVDTEMKAKLVADINRNADIAVGKVVTDLKNKIGKKQIEDRSKEQDDEIELYKLMSDKKTQMIKDDYEREKETLENRAQEEKFAVEKSIANAELKAKAIKTIEDKLAFDIQKLKDDTLKKESQTNLERLDNDLKFLQIRQEAIQEGTIEYYDAQREILYKSFEKELAQIDDNLLNEKIKTEEAEKQKLALKEKYSKLKDNISKKEIETYLSYVSAGLSAASSFISQQQNINSLAMENELNEVKGNAQEQDKIKEKYFYKNRDAQVGQAIISTLQSAISAYSSLAVIPVVGTVLGGIAAAAALAFGYKQVSLIKAQKYQGSSGGGSSSGMGKNYAEGGLIGGKRHSDGGTIIEAEKGEAIMTRGAVTMFAPLLSMLNQAGGGTSFSKGAVGQSNYDNPQTQINQMEQPIIKTYVVENELTTIQHRAARLKDLSTL